MCMRCNERKPEHGALCNHCREDLAHLAKMQREQGNAQERAAMQARQAVPVIARKRLEWCEAV